ncbi:hypothetical protein ACS0TY_004954 [Phlomoides rotata]
MAPDKNHQVVKAFAAMRSLGIGAETVKPVLKRLLKLYGGNWKLIEEDNYRTLADAIFEEQDDKLKVEKDNDMMEEDPEPAPKRQHREDSKVPVFSNGDNRRNGVTDPTSVLHHHLSELPSGSKGKGIRVHSDEGNSSLHPASGSAHCANREADTDDNPDSPYCRNKNAIVAREQQPIESHDQVITVSNGDRKKAFHMVNDITRGMEKVKISLLDEIGTEAVPKFVYCPQNTAYEYAYVHMSLARISNEDCCAKCIGDCLSSSIPCACASVTGGEFAYTPDGLLDLKLLKACIDIKNSSDTKDMVYCEVCPLQRAKNARKPGKCEGHVVRKFIKECWIKCGCNMLCGNRVVQRGISRNLQVFLTSDGKGWGLRTLEDLPQGAFVCEYVGEILTNIELYERNEKNSGKGKHVYPVLLDSDWTTEGTLKDEEALCLDATHFGNVARFINHRCHDGNLIDIPVQVETPDRHYYHVAFFTTRKVKALDELTWVSNLNGFDTRKRKV